MKQKTRLAVWSRRVLRATAGAIVVVGVAAVAAAFLVRWPVTDARLRNRIVHYVAASSGMTVHVSGPIRLRLLPRPVVELESVTLDGADGTVSVDADSLVGSLSLPALVMGHLRVAKTAFNEPTMAIDLDRLIPLLTALVQPTLAAQPPASAPNPLAFLHTGGLTFRSGLLRLKSQDPRRDMLLTDIWATLEWPGDGSGASLSGSAAWHGLPGDLTATLAAPGSLLRGHDSPAYLRLKSPALDLTAGGTLSGSGTRALGRLTASTPALQVFLRAVGTPAPELDGIREAEISGEATIADGALALTDVRLGLDAMLFEGAMAFRDHAGRPALAGTLATDDIDLGPFLKAVPSPLTGDARWSETSFETQSVADDDIDLRISASRARLGKIAFEDAGLSLQSGNGRMELSLGEARAYDGLFKGRMVAKLNGNDTEIRADATVSQLDLRALAKDFDGSRQLTGSATGHVTIEGHGQSTAELMASLTGRGQIGLRNGDIGPELTAMLVHPDPTRPESAVSAIGLDPTTFDSASVGFEIASGLAAITDGWILRPDFRIALEGSSSLPAQNADFRARIVAIEDSPKTAGTATVRVAGPWRHLTLSARRSEGALPLEARPALPAP